MNQTPNQPMKSSNVKRHGHVTVFLRLALIMFGFTAVWAQGPFISGSDGTNGDFNPTTSTTVSLPDTGVLHYKTVTIPSGVSVRFLRNARNTPVTILAQGAVTINGIINVSGENGQFFGGQGGPGGYDGGRGGYFQGDNKDGVNGSGPGGGAGARYVDATTTHTGGSGGLALTGSSGRRIFGNLPVTVTDPAGGTPYGTTTLVPLLGGSGGGGGTPFSNSNGGGGGGGGGAILIASSVSILGSGQVIANGGQGNFPNGFGGTASGGGGAGGAIRMVSNLITGSLTLSVNGGSSSGQGGSGYVRLEGVDTTRPPTISPSTALYTTSAPRPAIQNNAPQLRIVSVGGVNAPNFVTGSFNGADIYLPRQTGPVNVALAGTNLPLATSLQVVVVPPQGNSITVNASTLNGSQASSTATASITLPPGPSLIYATGIVDLTLISGLAPFFQNGERVRKMEISAVLGGVADITYITESGKRFKKSGE